MEAPPHFGYSPDMATIVRQAGFEIMIYSRDHEPPQVHVWRAQAELVVNLNPIEIRENNGMSPNDARKAITMVEEYQAELLIEWRRFHP